MCMSFRSAFRWITLPFKDLRDIEAKVSARTYSRTFVIVSLTLESYCKLLKAFMLFSCHEPCVSGVTLARMSLSCFIALLHSSRAGRRVDFAAWSTQCASKASFGRSRVNVKTGNSIASCQKALCIPRSDCGSPSCDL